MPSWNIKGFFRAAFARVPLVSGLAYASKKNLLEGTQEFLFIYLLTSIPLILNSAIDFFGNKSSPADQNRLLWAMSSNLQAGEVFIYVNALLAPVAVVLYKYNRDRVHFRNWLSFVVILFVSIGVTAFIFGAHRGGLIMNTKLLKPVALTIYFTTLFVRFLSIIYDAFRPNFVEQQRKQEQALTQQLDNYG